MKKSLYSIALPYSNLIVIYNTLRNSSVIIPQKSKAAWGMDAEGNIDINSLDDAKRTILQENHILIEDDVDEVALAQKQQYATNHNPERYEIVIIPTLGCNFRCWYCYEEHDHCDYMDVDDIERIISFVKHIVSERPQLKTLSIHFFGGEPLLRFNHIARPLMERIDSLMSSLHIGYEVGFTTNASLLNSACVDVLKRYHTDHLQITIDGNKERHNKVRYAHIGDNSYDLIIRNIKYAIHAGIHVCVRINISEDTSLNVKELLESFSDMDEEDRKLFHFSIHKVWQADKSVYDTITHIVEEIREGGFNAVSFHSAPSSLWSSCYSDKENHVTINPKGKIFKCTAREFHDDQIEGYLQDDGTVSWTDLHVHRTSVSVFDRPKCRRCPILPICVGGCSQKLIEQENNPAFCVVGDDAEIKEYALKVFNEKLNSGEIEVITNNA